MAGEREVIVIPAVQPDFCSHSLSFYEDDMFPIFSYRHLTGKLYNKIKG
jgi:hypothetical protein